MAPALELRGIVKRFPGVVANDRVSLSVAAGEIRALLGENGAGKTTLMNILYGLDQPDAGEIRLDGRPCRFDSPLDAIRAGLGMVHQHFMLFPSLTVAENVVFGAEPRKAGLLDRGAAVRAVAELAERFGLQVDPGARVGGLPVGVRQRIEILKMLFRGARILILDEPTAVLTPHERDRLFAILRALATAGHSVLFITHKLPEVFSVAERATVLRDGRVTGTVDTSATTAEELCRLMVGRDIELRVEKKAATPAEPVLRLRRLTARTGERRAFRDIDLEVRAGEILGIAGAAGNGQTELVETIAGLRPATGGHIELAGAPVDTWTVRQRRTAQSHVPEDRDRTGLALDASLSDNLLLGFEALSTLSRRGVLRRSAVRQHAEGLVQRHAVKARSISERAADLSGGNRQKLVLARELEHSASLLIAEQPTRGVDVGATEQIYRLLIDHRDRGKAVLLVSTDLSEILALSDRIVVMFEGRLVGELDGHRATEAELGLLMAGGRSPEATP